MLDIFSTFSQVKKPKTKKKAPEDCLEEIGNSSANALQKLNENWKGLKTWKRYKPIFQDYEIKETANNERLEQHFLSKYCLICFKNKQNKIPNILLMSQLREWLLTYLVPYAEQKQE